MKKRDPPLSGCQPSSCPVSPSKLPLSVEMVGVELDHGASTVSSSFSSIPPLLNATSVDIPAALEVPMLADLMGEGEMIAASAMGARSEGRSLVAEFGLPSTGSVVSFPASNRSAFDCSTDDGLVREEEVALSVTREVMGLEPADGLRWPPRPLGGPLRVMVEGNLGGDGHREGDVSGDAVQGVTGALDARVGICRAPTAARVEEGDVGFSSCRVGDGSMSVGDTPAGSVPVEN
ncbi:hypothetical protein Dimus_018312 [Dionaea muscipula]